MGCGRVWRQDTSGAADPRAKISRAGLRCGLTWSVYQRIVDSSRQPDRKIGRWVLEQVIDLITAKVPQQLTELASLGLTLTRRSGDILTYFDREGTSNGPPKPSTVGWNTSAVQPWDSRTWRTISHAHYWKPAGSGPGYTLNCEEPFKFSNIKKDSSSCASTL